MVFSLKNSPNTAAWEDKESLCLDDLRRFSVMSACGRRRAHSDTGNARSHVQRPVIK